MQFQKKNSLLLKESNNTPPASTAPLTPALAWVSFPVMKAATYYAVLLVLVLGVGCGKKEVEVDEGKTVITNDFKSV